MAQLADFISRIFPTGRTQGLSGGAEVVIDSDPASAFYTSRLRKHRTDDDLVAVPEHLWRTEFAGRPGGLQAHIHAERGDGVATFTDVLFIINQADARRAAAMTGEAWTERAARAISTEFHTYCQREAFELLYGTRPLRYWFVADGGADMLQHSFSLAPGEFVTGLLPNLYVGPSPRSRPVLALHANLPGVWEGYREIGRLYSDQMLFTLGRHWLDNFHHEALREPGLYRLQQFTDGTLVHVISPELQDRYVVSSDTVEGGASVITISERSGKPIAYLVLAIIEPATAAERNEPAPRPSGDAPRPSSDARLAVDSGIHTVRPVLDAARSPGAEARVPLREVPLQPESAQKSRLERQKTIVPGAVSVRISTLQERGALLQKVHFANFMEGYDVYIGPQGQVATQNVSPRATIQVRGSRATLLIMQAGIRVGGRVHSPGTLVPLDRVVDIEVDGHVLQYRDLSRVRADGWPYLGEIIRPGSGFYLDFGAAYRVGRDRRCKVRLPDEPHNDNIAWHPNVGTGTTIRSRNGDIPKSRFYTDSIMVASEHCEIDLSGEPTLRSLARFCYSYIRRGDEIIGLFPREGNVTGPREAVLRPGDDLLVGNCLFQMSWAPTGDQPARPAITANSAPAISGPPISLPPARPEPRPAQRGPLHPTRPDPPQAEPTFEFSLDPRPEPKLGPAARPEPPPAEPPRAQPPRLEPPQAEPPRAEPARAEPPRAVRPAIADTPGIALPPPRSIEVPAAPLMGERGPAPRQVNLPVNVSNSILGNYDAPSPRRVPDAARPPPPMLLGDVAWVDETSWRSEMARPARLTLFGWVVENEVTVGNHPNAAVVIPEVRLRPDQEFEVADYFRLNVRGQRGRAELLSPSEASIEVGGEKVTKAAELDRARLVVVRRDADREPDFEVPLTLRDWAVLSSPRARLLCPDTSQRIVLAMFTFGFGVRAERRLRLGRIEASFVYDGKQLQVSNFLDTYRATGFSELYTSDGENPSSSAPEDGRPFFLGPNHVLIVGNVVYRFQVNV